MTLYHRDARRWSPADDQVLREVYPTAGSNGVQQRLPNRPAESIRRRAKRLGLLTTKCSVTGHDWTASEEGKLRRLWSTASRESIEEALPGRSWTALAGKAQKLGLFRQRHVRKPPPSAPSAHPIIRQIRERIVTQGWTNKDVSLASGLRRHTTFYWFNDRAQPKLAHVEKVVESLGGKLTIVWD